jgi:glycosyltransferase involved in cell wall biosynthesis
MKIGIDVTPIIQEKPTGVHLITRHLTEALIRADNEHELVLFAAYPRALKPKVEAVINSLPPGFKFRSLPLPARLFHNSMDYWQALGWPPIEWLVGELDVFHSFDWFTLGSRAIQTVTIFDLTTELFPQWHTQENSQIQQHRLKAARRYGDWFFCLSKQTQADWIKWSGIEASLSEVVYPALPLKMAKQAPKPKQRRDKPPRLKDYFLAVGTLEPRKNLSRVVEAHGCLPKKLQQAHPLVIVGNVGWGVSKWLDSIKDKKTIHLAGYVDNQELPNWYSRARALLYPSLYEGFGLPVLEALEYGCPVLTSKVSSLPEVAADAAVYCDPYKVDSIAQGMRYLAELSDTQLAERRRRGKQRAEYFSYETSAQQMIGRWERLTEARK